MLFCGNGTNHNVSSINIESGVVNDTLQMDPTMKGTGVEKDSTQSVAGNSQSSTSNVNFGRLNQEKNMRGFEPASENDMNDNGMSRYMETTDDEGWGVMWVPRELNLVISRLMDAGKAFFCRIEDVMLVNDYWVKIDAKIYMVE